MTVPKPPQGFAPPDDVTGMLGKFNWWTKWTDLDPTEAGASTVYDPQKDRVIIEPRPDVFHDEMVRTMIEKSPFPRLPAEVYPGAVMNVGDVPSFDSPWRGDLPTIAESMMNVLRTQRSTVKNRPEKWTREVLYKHVAAMHTVDIPPSTMVEIGYNDRNARRSHSSRGPTTATVQMADLYRELRFDDKLPQKKVRYDRGGVDHD